MESLPTRDDSEQIQYRQKILCDIIENAKLKNDTINENYLLHNMKFAGIIDYTRSKLYQDRLAIDSQNNYIRNFLPRYSKYQEDINNELDEIREECIELSRGDLTVIKIKITQTPDGLVTKTKITESESKKIKTELLKIRAKVAELKQKHSEGQNINISAVIVQRELAEKRMQIEKLQEEKKFLKVNK